MAQLPRAKRVLWLIDSFAVMRRSLLTEQENRTHLVNKAQEASAVMLAGDEQTREEAHAPNDTALQSAE